MKQKKFMDIEALREFDTDLQQGNGFGFVVGDIVQISEKVDGSNFAIAYDGDTQSLVAFSRNRELSWDNTLNGAWNYAQSLDVTPFANHPTWFVFGEWSGARNRIVYDARFKNKWIVYDIYDTETEQWQTQDVVRKFCEEAGLEYIHVFYEGSFISWEHCRSFCHSPNYGESIEGIVCKDLTRLNNPNSRLPFYIKIVNEEYKETSKPRVRVVNEEKEAAKSEAQILAESIVTRNRVLKLLFKARDEGILPKKLTPHDLGNVAKILPKMVYEDCLKEEKEIVVACGEFFGKQCSSITMKHVRDIVLYGI